MRLIPTIAAFCTIANTSLASPKFWVHEWPNTDFENTSVENWVEILSGGPSKDGIPAQSDPDFGMSRTKTAWPLANPLSPLKSKGLCRAPIRSAI